MSKVYPSHHPRGKTWSTDEAWDIVDMIDDMLPGQVTHDARLLLAGMIAGTIDRIAKNPQAAIDRWQLAQKKRPRASGANREEQ